VLVLILLLPFSILLLLLLLFFLLQEVKYGEGEDHPDDEFVEPKFEEIPGTLEHLTELMVEKVGACSRAESVARLQDLRVRLPLPELEVLLEPL
jgi:hypothetical protein